MIVNVHLEKIKEETVEVEEGEEGEEASPGETPEESKEDPGKKEDGNN